MPILHLTDIAVRGLKTPGTYTDESTPGFCLRVGKNRKTWFVIRGKERVRTNIGRYPSMSLADARKKALVLLGSPIEPKVKPKKFTEALQAFFDIHVPTLKPRTQREIKRVLNRHFAKPFRNKDLDQITHEDIASITDALAQAAPSEAWHAFKDARTFFRWCVPRYLKHAPVEGLKSPTKYIARKRVLRDNELTIVWRTAVEVGYPFGTALQLSTLWGTRWSETIGCRRPYINEKERLITLPDTKNGTEFCFPYGEMSAAILDTIPRFNSTDLLFPGRDPEKPWNGAGKAKWQFDKLCKIDPWQILDLRRTFATKIAERRDGLPDVPPYIIEQLLNHQVGTLQTQGVISAVAMVYNRARYLPEMRQAIEQKWEPLLTQLLQSRH
jgi:integrase